MKKKVETSLLKKYWWLALVAVVPIFMVVGKIYSGLSEDHSCQKSHVPTTLRPSTLTSASDWLTMGDVDYESGNCTQAIKDLDEAIKINPKFAEAYNNRAFIKIRLQQYPSALSDLDKAIELRPAYPHALMNRGDIYKNYLKDKAKALADYEQVISMGKEIIKSEAVCGRRLMALYDGNWFRAMWDIVTKHDDTGCLKLYFEK